MGEVLLKVSGMEASQGSFSIRDVEFTLESGTLMGLVGKSGSGKSTIIKTILGMTSSESGNIWVSVDGEERDIRSIVGYSPQENSLYPFLSIQENLETFARMRGVDSGAVRERSRRLLNDLQIFEDRHKRVKNLSGGMKKRADLAVCLLHDPEILVMDEPFRGIDPPQREVIWDNIEQLRDRGKAIIVTSHLLGSLTQRCDEFGLVRDGKYYRSHEIKGMMHDSDYRNLESFLHDVFRI